MIVDCGINLNSNNEDVLCSNTEGGIKKSESLMTLSTVESFDEMSLENLEELIDDLISGKKNLKELPSLTKYEDEIQCLPKVPREPGEFECCGTGCQPCIWDKYNRDLERHQRAKEDLCEKIQDEGNFPL
jgi:hypothetical protein